MVFSLSGLFNLVPKSISAGSDPINDVVNSGEETTFNIEVQVLSDSTPLPMIQYEVKFHLSHFAGPFLQSLFTLLFLFCHHHFYLFGILLVFIHKYGIILDL